MSVLLRRVCGVMVGCVLCGSAVMAQPAPSDTPAAPPALFQAPLPTVAAPGAIRYPRGVVGLQDITYKTLSGYRPLKLDLYVPRNTRARHPAIVWIHGGGWRIGDPRSDWTYGDWTQVMAELSGRGYVVAAITYRFVGEASFPAQIEDVKDAIRFVRKHADLYGVDPDRIAAWGLSAGGHLAALAGTSCQADKLNVTTSYPGISSCVQAAVDWFGPTDLALAQQGASSPLLAQLMGCAPQACTAQDWAAGSAVTYVTRQAPPFLIMQGEADALVPPVQSQRLAEVLQANGVDTQLIIYPGLGHGFTGATRQQERQILETAFAFFDEKLKQVKTAR